MLSHCPMSTERAAFARPSFLSKQLGIGLALALFSLLRVVAYAQWTTETYSVVDRKSTRLNSSHT